MTKDPRAGADLTDDALQDEIELVGDLVVAASAKEEPLTEDEIDEALGIDRGHASGRPRTEGRARRSPGREASGNAGVVRDLSEIGVQVSGGAGRTCPVALSGVLARSIVHGHPPFA